ncbi:MAG: hypothetical protein LBE78_01475 [Burkholderiaceae bacterium]|jgi:hypothetical protein|nr:hypothetical protein [Burkholderiaceae bacterium]
MKKSILSLSVAAALGGLCFAGPASAIAVFDRDGSTAEYLYPHPAGTGHMLYTPYYTAQNGLGTTITIINTDRLNGKAVKVRFRNATNSDDVLDFTLLLSPGDVWSGAVTRGSDGYAQVSAPDDETSCTIPLKASGLWPGKFKALRLPSYLNDNQKAALTREGYVEVLNMADIPPGSNLFTAIKHVNGKAPCESGPGGLGIFSTLMSPEWYDAGDARAIGLDNPTGQLMGSWAVLNLSDLGVFSGAQTAIIASATNISGVSASMSTAPANFAFAPQLEDDFLSAVSPFIPTTYGPRAGLDFTINHLTADPLLTNDVTGGNTLDPLWYDLPDMSTPLLNTAGMATIATTDPIDQAELISDAMAKTNVVNEYMATKAGAAVPFNTDWVVSQPTRRYHAVMDYAGSYAAASIVQRTASGGSSYYWDLNDNSMLSKEDHGYGPVACVKLRFGSYDREEGVLSAFGGFSPGTVVPYCGEVFTAQFGTTSTLRAEITATSVNSLVAGDAGWAIVSTTAAGTAMPMVGYAAILFVNQVSNTTYNQTLPHRWLAP